uniref:Uncharacterized protein n=1 Tax=Rhizophora mucronata TaxID=61149 RepID=A0A2P2Q597_RHIMU
MEQTKNYGGGCFWRKLTMLCKNGLKC